MKWFNNVWKRLRVARKLASRAVKRSVGRKWTAIQNWWQPRKWASASWKAVCSPFKWVSNLIPWKRIGNWFARTGRWCLNPNTWRWWQPRKWFATLRKGLGFARKWLRVKVKLLKRSTAPGKSAHKRLVNFLALVIGSFALVLIVVALAISLSGNGQNQSASGAAWWILGAVLLIFCVVYWLTCEKSSSHGHANDGHSDSHGGGHGGHHALGFFGGAKAFFLDQPFSPTGGNGVQNVCRAINLVIWFCILGIPSLMITSTLLQAAVIGFNPSGKARVAGNPASYVWHFKIEQLTQNNSLFENFDTSVLKISSEEKKWEVPTGDGKNQKWWWIEGQPYGIWVSEHQQASGKFKVTGWNPTEVEGLIWNSEDDPGSKPPASKFVLRRSMRMRM